MGAQLPARWPSGSERRVQCQIVPWIDWKELWPVSCSAWLGGVLRSDQFPTEQSDYHSATMQKQPTGQPLT